MFCCEPFARGTGQAGRDTVPFMARLTGTAEVIARAALAFIEENGVDALTIRALGAEAGLHHTAAYRHYRSKNDVLRAVLGLVLEEAISGAGELPADPRERLLVLARSLRSALHAHPAVTTAYLTPAESLADSDTSNAYQQEIVDALRGLGLRGNDLLVRHQMLETFVLGSCVFDFGGAPDHLDSRRRRHRLIADPDFEAVTRSNDGVDALNEAAFDHGLVVLLDEIAAAGRRALDEDAELHSRSKA